MIKNVYSKIVLNFIPVSILTFIFVILTIPLKILNSEEFNLCQSFLNSNNSENTINASELKMITEKYKNYIDNYLNESIESFSNNSISHGIGNLYFAGEQLQILQNCIAKNIPKIK